MALLDDLAQELHMPILESLGLLLMNCIEFLLDPRLYRILLWRKADERSQVVLILIELISFIIKLDGLGVLAS